jgi:hypothetical protein
VAALVLACFCVAGAVEARTEDVRLGPEQPVATARVVEVEVGLRSWETEVAFTTSDGHVVRAWLWGDLGAPGERVQVRYDPDAPDRYVRGADARGNAVWVVGLVVAAMALVAVSVLAATRVLDFPLRTD